MDNAPKEVKLKTALAELVKSPCTEEDLKVLVSWEIERLEIDLACAPLVRMRPELREGLICVHARVTPDRVAEITVPFEMPLMSA